ncbi:hypothetical protein C8R43DRAFT_1122721 [Mycena crocata]|nr:hypothetical protein C8R43DRAFT_1122721 [Mycena crocata]
MPRAGTAARKRARQGLPDPKPGRVSWVHGRKLLFMLGYREGYLEAAALGKDAAGRFYDKVAAEYLKIFGYKLPWKDDLSEDLDVASDVDEDEDEDDLARDVAEARSTYFDVLRNKIGIWFRTEYGGAKSKKKGTLTFRKMFDKEELNPPQPVKAREVHFYSRRFFKERVKWRVDARLAAMPNGADKKKIIAVTNTITKECWLAETAAFRAEVVAELEAEHAAAMAAYQSVVSGDTPTTPEEFQVALDNAAYYLEPFVNAVSDKFGMNVSLMILHAGTSKGLVPRIWVDYDRAGWEAARRSFRDFTEQCFSIEERRARSLNGIPEAMASSSEDSGRTYSSQSGAGEVSSAPVGGKTATSTEGNEESRGDDEENDADDDGDEDENEG